MIIYTIMLFICGYTSRKNKLRKKVKNNHDKCYNINKIIILYFIFEIK